MDTTATKEKSIQWDYPSTQKYDVKGGSKRHSANCTGVCADWKTRDMAQQGEQTNSDMKEIDIPHPWPRLKEMLEIVGSKNSS